MDDVFRLEGKRILVTGASSGLGREIAVSASRAGAEVIASGRNSDRLGETMALLDPSRSHQSITGDVVVDEDLANIVDVAGPIDGVVHAAGIRGPIPVRVVTRAFVQERFDANYFGPLLLTQRILAKSKLRANGSIVFISSIAAHTGTRGMSV